MENKNNLKAWLYLAPALILLAAFMIYPLIDVFTYSFEENYSFLSPRTGIGLGNYIYVLKDANFLYAIKNTIIVVLITVPTSTIIAIFIAVGLNSIKFLQRFFQTIFFLPYVTNTIAVGIVFMIMFNKVDNNQLGLVNNVLKLFGIDPIDFISHDGPYAAKMFALCSLIIWNVMPFKVIVLIGALQGVKKEYYNAAKVDGASRFTTFRKVTIPMISPMISYLVITGFIGAFKQYNEAVALFGTNLNGAGMNTMVGYIYETLYGVGGFPSYASAAAIILFAIILTITVINLIVSNKKVYYS
jgi:multiple sugar transport system permease protein